MFDVDAQINIRRVELNAQAKIDKANRAEAMELIVSYAQDIVKAWPTMTLRTLWQMTTKIENLKQALELLK